MSLKAFHLFFVTVCTLMAAGLGVWAVRDYRQTSDSLSLSLAVGSLIAAPAMLVYGRWFVRKLKNVSYL